MSVANTECNIGGLLINTGDYENALLHLQEALDIYLKSVGPLHPPGWAATRLASVAAVV